MSGSIRLTDPTLKPMERLLARLLVVDDNAIIRRVIGALLERLGYRVDTAGEVGYDLVFMDCAMPRMDGIETTALLRAGGGPSARAPIVGLSGHAGEDARARGLEAGMSDYLAKPVRLRTLQDTLTRWLPEPRDERPAS